MPGSNDNGRRAEVIWLTLLSRRTRSRSLWLAGLLASAQELLMAYKSSVAAIRCLQPSTCYRAVILPSTRLLSL